MWRFAHLSDDEAVAKMGHPVWYGRWGLGWVEESGRLLPQTIPHPIAKYAKGWGTRFCGGHPDWWRFTHLSDDEAVAKMGHPVLGWSVNPRLRSETWGTPLGGG
jgi:hypothetical protein